MSWEAWVTLALVLLVLYVLARNAAGPDVTLAGGAAVLTSLGAVSDRFPSPTEMAASFGNEGLLTVAALFVVAAGLTETGAIALLTERVLGRPRSEASAQVRLILPVAGISAFVNNTPVVAVFIPVVQDWCRRTGLTPSRLFIPLSYAAILGGCCTLIGTSTTLVVQGLMIRAQRTDSEMPTMGMFTIGAVGVPAALAGIGYLLAVSRRLLPDRRPPADARGDPRQYTVEMFVQSGSPIDGKTIEEAGLRHLPGMYLAAIERDGESLVAVGADQTLRGGDRLMFVGIVESVVDLQRVRGLRPATDQIFKLTAPRRDRCLVEAVVSATCPLVGKSVREGRFRSRYDAAVIAVHREGERISKKIGDIVLAPGDTLLLETHPRFLKYQRHTRDFLLASAVADSSTRRHERAWIALGILAAMVVAVTFEQRTGLTVFNGALLAAGLMLATRCCSPELARSSIDLSVLLAIGSALGIGRAIETSGLAGFVAGQMTGWVRTADPRVVLAAVYLLTLAFTELVTNNAAAALSFPIAHAVARELGVDFMPFGIVVAIAASAGFATPLGYQTHLMVYGSGGYRFSDFVRVGAPLDLIVMVVTVWLAPVFFPFRS